MDVTSDTNIYKVSLSEGVMKSARWRAVEGYDVAWINTVASEEASSSAGAGGGGSLADLLLVPLSQHATPPHDTVFLGELRLSDFNDMLTKAGFRVCVLLLLSKS